MSDETAFLEFASDDALAGFRLERLEVLNWGTFHNRVWSIHPKGRNSLLTGDIGSGKSTLVDAITTLLVPANRIVFNKAAGAESKERSLRSYVLGYYRTERNESGLGVARPVGLRDANTLSVLLAVFRNVGFDQTVSLACVFSMKDPQGQPARFYVGAEHALSIAKDFSGFDSNINQLRRQLRQSGAQIFDVFTEYSAWFRRRFGIENEQALDLFHQTVSMKSIGNLTDFVREHMIEAFDIQSRIDALIGHFEDLDRAYRAILHAKKQIAQLEPIVTDFEQHESLQNEIEQLIGARNLLSPYLASQKRELLQVYQNKLIKEKEQKQQELSEISERLLVSQQDAEDLKQQIARNGGDRIAVLTANIERLAGEREQRKKKATDYLQLLQQLEKKETMELNASVFLSQQSQLAELRTDEETRRNRIENERTELAVQMRNKQDALRQLETELESLLRRRSNIASGNIRIREMLCEAIAATPEQIPFVGELLQVRKEAGDWEGAIERLLHAFALSLLVPDALYEAVADWVNRTHLHGRVVYFRVRLREHAKASPAPDLHPQSVLHKLSVRQDSEFYAWLDQELARRFDVACCEDLQQFRRETHAITCLGQIKIPGGRHEKDDRYRIEDRTRYILGWNNETKITVLKKEKTAVEESGSKMAMQIANQETELARCRERRSCLDKLEVYRSFREMDWQSVTSEIATLEAERHRLQSASDILRELNTRLQNRQSEIQKQFEKKSVIDKSLGAIETKMEINQQQIEEVLQLLESVDAEALAKESDRLRDLCRDALGEYVLSIKEYNRQEHEASRWLQKQIDINVRTTKSLGERLVGNMRQFCTEFPSETREFDAAVESGAEFREVLKRLRSDDLPRFEERFKELLNKNTIREIANFSAHLNQQREKIRERVDRINRSLKEIDYNPGRYIVLEATATADREIHDFQNDLRACTEGALTGSEDEQYSESKFRQVKKIIERFQGREGMTDLDKRWTRKVTDVRNWFTFAASERWREDDREHEHYSDSGGKSGGQKEKLAYTVLAASLAYQFGLEWGQVKSRSFRFVVIDEAFGRGSDESAQYGLRLFEKLNLQLLIVTPLQKIHIIEPFVSSVGFVDNVEGKNSRIRNLTIEAYREEKAHYRRTSDNEEGKEKS